jgi:hypothetical protein
VNRLEDEPPALASGYVVLDDRPDQQERQRRERLKRARRFIFALALPIVAVTVFQLFFRYDYVTGAGNMYRIDRLTHQVCRLRSAVAVDCSWRGVRGSASLSTSTSTSTSVSP